MLASGNRHKLGELRSILAPHDLIAMPAGVVLPPEGEDSFEENARIKARGLATALLMGASETGARSGVPHPVTDLFLADDSGLEVQALGWAPGVISARYAGVDASDAQNNAKLLSQLKGYGSAERRARFVCVMVAVRPDLTEMVTRGEWWGTITTGPHGEGGFGYDPVFRPDGSDLTVAQLPQAVKDTLSHRALAAKALLDLLAEDGSHGEAHAGL